MAAASVPRPHSGLVTGHQPSALARLSLNLAKTALLAGRRNSLARASWRDICAAANAGASSSDARFRLAVSARAPEFIAALTFARDCLIVTRQHRSSRSCCPPRWTPSSPPAARRARAIEIRQQVSQLTGTLADTASGQQALFTPPGTTRRARPADTARTLHRLTTELATLAATAIVIKRVTLRRAPAGTPAGGAPCSTIQAPAMHDATAAFTAAAPGSMA
jgi:hypothetical protein